MENENDDLIVPSNFGNYSQSSDDIQINQGDIFNYRGYFVDKNQHGDNDEDDTQKFYEFGAHFPYYFLVQKLEILKMENDKQNKKPSVVRRSLRKEKTKRKARGRFSFLCPFA
jgi:protein involved in sex pheromone biosynthesis